MKNLITLLLLTAAQTVFAQTPLEFYLRKATAQSPLLFENQNLNQANQLEAERLKAFYTQPQVALMGAYVLSPVIATENNQTRFLLNPDVPANYVGYDLAYSNGGQYQAMVNVNQPLFNGKRYQISAEQLNVSTQINDNNTRLNAHDLEKLVTDQYLLCLQDNQQILYARAMLVLLEEQRELLLKLVEGNIYKQSDLTLLKIETRNFEVQLNSSQSVYRRDLLDLNILCGINDTSLAILLDPELSLRTTSANSNFLEKYRLDSLDLVTRQKISELQYRPQVNLFANAGLNAVYAPTLPRRFGVTGGITFNYTLYDGNQRNLTRGKTQFLKNSVSNYKQSFLTRNSVRKTSILREMQSFEERITLVEGQTEEYDLLLKSSKKEMVSGQISVLNLITILKNKAALERDLELLRLQKQSLINAFNYWNW
ncbi:MAG: TolC family protein [Bacteroidia bacterium]|nr:TolC family protein [Bacteroidia bacterium]